MLYRNLDPNKPKNFVEKASRENLWHADVTYKKAPPRGAVLRRELGPETGGDTIWSNMVMAYENLPEPSSNGSTAYTRSTAPSMSLAPRCRRKSATRWPRRTRPPSIRLCSPTLRRAKRSCS